MHAHDIGALVAIAKRVFGDPEKAKEWFDQPRVQLGGRTPNEMLKIADGYRRVEELLTQIADDRQRGTG